MSVAPALFPDSPAPADALLRERLALVESRLLDSRLKMMDAFDSELRMLRGWMQAMLPVDPADHQIVSKNVTNHDDHILSLKRPEGGANIVKLPKFEPEVRKETVAEAKSDPLLEQATVEELNAALAAAFSAVADCESDR